MLNVVFISNYFNHHQKFLSDALFGLTERNYTFIATKKIGEHRLKLGWGGGTDPEYVLKTYEDNQSCADYQAIIDEADVALLGSAPYDLLKNRLSGNKLAFCYSERIFRNGYEYFKWPVRFLRMYFKYTRYRKLYLLCASAYVAADYAITATFINKAYKWGYFTECIRYENIDTVLAQKDPMEILWCGRLIGLKHPDDVLKVAKALKNNGYRFCIKMIGIGEEEAALKQYVDENELGDVVSFLGAMEPSKVRRHMEKAGIYLFTSDRQEGWGAVLNESMNSGCAVVASHAIGSVPFLIKNKENGLIYESGNVNMLYEKVAYLLDHPQEQKSLGAAAYSTIVTEWNAEVAAQRFLNLANRILEGESSPDLYESGPCSKAEILKDNWFKG